MTAAADKKARRTARVPVTTMEELPILSEEERAEMPASVKAAEARFIRSSPPTARALIKRQRY